MKFIGFEREEEAEAWARERLDVAASPELFRAMSLVDDKDDFQCVVVFSNFTPRNVDLNIVGEPRWATPKATITLFNEVFSYAFKMLRAARVTALVRGKNEVCKRFIEHLGFKLEGVMRSAFVDDDLHIYGFLAEDYHSHAWCRG